MNSLVLLGLYICIGLVIIMVIRALFEKRTSKTPANTSHYKSKKYLMTKHEFEYFKKIKSQVEQSGNLLFTKVRLADIIETSDVSRSERTSAFNKIRSKHIDFVVCNASTGEIVKCIELQDSSHTSPDRKQRDQFIEQVLQEAEIPFEKIW